MRISRQIGWSTEANLIYELIRQTERLTITYGQNQPGFRVPISKPLSLSTESNLYYEWLRSLCKFTAQVADCCNTTTTTTTTALPVPGNAEIAADPNFNIVGDFTIEMFINMSNLAGFPRPYSFGAYPAPNAISIEGGQMYFWANGGALVSGAFAPNIGQWYHICVMGSGATVYLFVDGVVIGSAPYGGSISSGGLPLTIAFGNEPNSYFSGLMTNFRWTYDNVYSTGGFTVPTAPLASLTSTILLIFQGTTLPLQLTDNSGNGNNATATGGVAYSANNPFAPSAPGSVQFGV